MFQSTHPRGVRLRVAGGPGAGGMVSIHAPAWGATTRALGCRPTENRFQSTHPRGVRLAHRFDGRKDPLVSIHAPAWGATVAPAKNFQQAAFQSTHPRGVRHAEHTRQSRRPGSFNPRTRVGCDRVRGVYRPHRHCFNPRTRVGCDVRLMPQGPRPTLFQSTHPRGVRLAFASMTGVV